MIETITPAVCGSRRRHVLAVSLFALAAVLSAAALGAALGLVGLALGAAWAVAAAAAFAGAAALRELGVVRFPLPQSRRQVPERWHAELPLPLWATGYGAGLGHGVHTFQPVAMRLAVVWWLTVVWRLAVVLAGICRSKRPADG
jgi:hypothetical protein